MGKSSWHQGKTLFCLAPCQKYRMAGLFHQVIVFGMLAVVMGGVGDVDSDDLQERVDVEDVLIAVAELQV